ncbi:hypothetical protein RIF29_05833 [Crotalaria pallida]|uniref:Uncharacterized protein n=1 Tax=Crotalaria pallida TaxID=3830 RepID=A0AAN9PAW2_CROPI
MKTISGNCVSTKQISLSKAAKILSKFVSADNGASQVSSAYLHRASAAFNELKQLHKELKSPHSHKKHERPKTEEIHDDSGKLVENSIQNFEISRELNHRRHFDSENADEDGKKSTQTAVKFRQELYDSIEYDAGSLGSENHKKNKKRKQGVESRHDRDSRVKVEEREDEGKLPTSVENETKSVRQQGDEGYGNMGIEEGKKQKKEKKKKDKEGEGKLHTSVKNETESGQEHGNEGDSNTGMEEGKKQKKEKKKDKEGKNTNLSGIGCARHEISFTYGSYFSLKLSPHLYTLSHTPISISISIS